MSNQPKFPRKSLAQKSKKTGGRKDEKMTYVVTHAILQLNPTAVAEVWLLKLLRESFDQCDFKEV